jgi:quinol monooxygenase YgiN
MSIEQITIVCFIQAKQDTKKSVKDQLVNLAERTRQEVGNLNYDLHISDSDDSFFIIYENWCNQESLDSHMAQSYLKEFLTKQEKWLEKPIDAKMCKIIK